MNDFPFFNFFILLNSLSVHFCLWEKQTWSLFSTSSWYIGTNEINFITDIYHKHRWPSCEKPPTTSELCSFLQALRQRSASRDRVCWPEVEWTVTRSDQCRTVFEPQLLCGW